MSKFSYVKQTQVTEQTTAEFTLPDVFPGENGVPPVLILAPSTKENTDMVRAALKEPAQVDRRMSPDETIAALTAARIRRGERFAEFCLRGWRGVVDAEGKPVPYTKEDGLELMVSLARDSAWIFDEIVGFCNDASNFAKHVRFDAAAKSGNSGAA